MIVDGYVEGGLQVFPLRSHDEFESEDDFWDYLELVNRYNNGLGPRRRPQAPATVSRKGESRQVGVKLDLDDYRRLARVADLHGVSPTTLARIFVVGGARAMESAEGGEKSEAPE